MSDDYLFDKSGKSDKEIERLERILSTQRYRRPEMRRIAPRKATRTVLVFALAASFVLAAGVGSWALFRERRPAPVASVASSTPSAEPVSSLSFEVARIDGAPRIGDKAFDATARLGVGTWLETDPKSRAKITVADIGHLEVEPGTRIRLVETGTTQHRLDLDRGAIRAKVNAPPRLFVIGTASATAVDLGCAYSLRVDEKTGEGTLKVTSGWVSLETPTRVSMVPAGAMCTTRKGVGPGTPYFEDAAPAFVAALLRFDFETGGKAELPALCKLARKRDSLTLWHLLTRVEAADRPVIYARLTEFTPLPPTLDKAKVLAADRVTLDLWRKDLEAQW